MAPQEAVDGESPEPDVGVGHRHPVPSSSVADGSGIGAGGLGPDPERAAWIHTGEGASPGTHRVDVDDRNGHGLARDLELACV